MPSVMFQTVSACVCPSQPSPYNPQLFICVSFLLAFFFFFLVSCCAPKDQSCLDGSHIQSHIGKKKSYKKLHDAGLTHLLVCLAGSPVSHIPGGCPLLMVSAEKLGIKLLRLRHLASQIPWFVSQPVSKYCKLHRKRIDLHLNCCAPHMLGSVFF